MQQFLSFSASLHLNNVSTKEVFSNLEGITQKTLALAPATASTFGAISRVLYIRTSQPITLVLSKGTESISVVVTSTCLLTDSYDSIGISNGDLVETAYILLVFA